MRPMNNLEMLNENGEEIIMLETEKNVVKSEWNNILDKKFKGELIRNCPACNYIIKYSRRDSLNKAIKNKYVCKKCFVKKWQEDKYGKKEDQIFESRCINCGKIKIHKWKNLTEYKVKNLSYVASKRMCRKCAYNILIKPHIKFSLTGLEIKLHNILKKLNIKFTPQYNLEYRNFDVYLNDLNILIETDGDYWHGRNIPFEKLTLKQKQMIENDSYKNELAKQNNIRLIRLWQDEVTEERLKLELGI